MTNRDLELLLLYDLDAWDEFIPYLAARVQQEIALGGFVGLTEGEVLDNILTKTLTITQLETFITTTLANYSRSVSRLQMDEAPDDQLYQYVGPIDEKTRDECLTYGMEDPMTLNEIEGKGWGASLYEGGGFNCRHSWESIGTGRFKVAERMYNPTLAEELLKDGN